MNAKKTSIISMIAIVVIASGMYGISSISPTVTVGALYQLQAQTFEQKVQSTDLVVIGTVTKVGTAVIDDIVWDTNAEGIDYIFEQNKLPRAAITINIEEILKDNTGKSPKTITYFDDVNVGTGKSDENIARYVSQYALDYKVGEKAIFFIDDDGSSYQMLGFASKYDISVDNNELQVVQSKLDIVLEKAPLDIEIAKNTAIETARVQNLK